MQRWVLHANSQHDRAASHLLVHVCSDSREQGDQVCFQVHHAVHISCSAYIMQCSSLGVVQIGTNVNDMHHVPTGLGPSSRHVNLAASICLTLQRQSCDCGRQSTTVRRQQMGTVRRQQSRTVCRQQSRIVAHPTAESCVELQVGSELLCAVVLQLLRNLHHLLLACRALSMAPAGALAQSALRSRARAPSLA